VHLVVFLWHANLPLQRGHRASTSAVPPLRPWTAAGPACSLPPSPRRDRALLIGRRQAAPGGASFLHPGTLPGGHVCTTLVLSPAQPDSVRPTMKASASFPPARNTFTSARFSFRTATNCLKRWTSAFSWSSCQDSSRVASLKKASGLFTLTGVSGGSPAS